MKLWRLLKRRSQATIIRSEYAELGLSLSLTEAEQIAENYRSKIHQINRENPRLLKMARLNPKSIEYSILHNVVSTWEKEQRTS